VKVRHEGVFVVGGFRNPDAFDGVLVREFRHVRSAIRRSALS
jgi:hypothetical protein